MTEFIDIPASAQPSSASHPFLNIPLAISEHPALKRQPSAKLVYGALKYHARNRDRCFPRRKLIAEECGISVRTVSRALKLLEENGLIRRVPIFVNGDQRPNIYVLKDLSDIDEKLSTSDRVTPPCHDVPQKREPKNLKEMVPPIPPPSPPDETVKNTDDVDEKAIKTLEPKTVAIQDETTTVKKPTKLKIPPEYRRREIKPETPEEAALWCLAFDRGYHDRPWNRWKLRYIVDHAGGTPLLKRLVKESSGPEVQEPGALLQRKLSAAIVSHQEGRRA